MLLLMFLLCYSFTNLITSLQLKVVKMQEYLFYIQ